MFDCIPGGCNSVLGGKIHLFLSFERSLISRRARGSVTVSEWRLSPATYYLLAVCRVPFKKLDLHTHKEVEEAIRSEIQPRGGNRPFPCQSVNFRSHGIH